LIELKDGQTDNQCHMLCGSYLTENIRYPATDVLMLMLSHLGRSCVPRSSVTMKMSFNTFTHLVYIQTGHNIFLWIYLA